MFALQLTYVSRSQNSTGPAKVLPVNCDTNLHSSPIGGGALELFNFQELTSFIIFSQGKKPEFETQAFKYIDHLKVHEAVKKYSEKNLFLCQMPLHSLVSKLSLNYLQDIAKQHHISLLVHATKNNVSKSFCNHSASCWNMYMYLNHMTPYLTREVQKIIWIIKQPTLKMVLKTYLELLHSYWMNIFRILTNVFETLIPFFRKTSVIAMATLRLASTIFKVRAHSLMLVPY